MKRTTLTKCAVAALMATTSIASADQINLRLGSGHPIGLLAYTETASEWFAPELKRRIEDRTDHTVRIQELHAGQVARVTEILSATRDGILDIGFVSMIFEPSNLFPQNFGLFLPFNSGDAHIVTEAAQATYQAFPELYTVFEEQFNQVYLGGACLENYGLGSTFAWTDFSDLSGKRIAGAGTNLDWLVGATAVASNLNEAYQSMQSGVYEGYISASPWWHSFNLNEVAPYFTKTDFGSQYLNAVTINKQAWDRLPADVQEILREVGAEWSEVTADVCAKNDEAGLDRLRELGVDVREITDEAKVDWATALRDFPQRMGDEMRRRNYTSGVEIMNFYMDKVEELGHTWAYRYEVE